MSLGARIFVAGLLAVWAAFTAAAIRDTRGIEHACAQPLVLRTSLPPDALARSLHDWMSECDTQRARCQDAVHGAACDYARDRCFASWKEN